MAAASVAGPVAAARPGTKGRIRQRWPASRPALRGHRPDEAIKSLKASSPRPDSAEAHLLLGIAYRPLAADFLGV
jgi:hypothetical protein